jgi:hypothetical protein
MPRINKTELIKLQKTLKTDPAIGKKFGITRQAVHQIREKFGLPPVWTKNDTRNSKIYSLYKKGFTGTAIAKKMGLSIAQTLHIIHNLEKKAPAKKNKK